MCFNYICFNIVWFQKVFWFKFLSIFFSPFFPMGPKKAMKSMKAGLGKSAMKSALGKAVKKTVAKAKAKGKAGDPKNKLNKANLEKLWKMSLDEKIQAAAESGGTVEEQAEVLKDGLTKQEHAKVWGRHQTHLQKNPLEKEELEGLSKKEKGVKAAEWLMKTAGKKYLHVSREVTASESLEKDNTWKSEKQMMDQFGADELWAHCASGRVVYRGDPPNLVKRMVSTLINSITRRQWALVLETSLGALEKAARALEKVLERAKGKGKALERAKGLASWPSKTKRRRKRMTRRRMKMP